MAAPAEQVERAAAMWRRSAHAIALTGAGVSTGSCIPDFRSPRVGIWTDTEAMRVASLTTFRYAPEEFFAWVRPLVGQIRRAEPNAAHSALAALEAQSRLHTVITQNIDELHRRAGSRHVLELHGSLETATCVRCWRVWPAAAMVDQFVLDGQLPACPDCGGLVKPNITLMGEQLPLARVRAAQSEARRCDLMLVAGSSLEVMPAGGLPVEALNHGARLIVVNQQPTYVDERADIVIHGDVVQVVPALAAAITGVEGFGDAAC